MEDVTPAEALERLQPLLTACLDLKESYSRLPFWKKWAYLILRHKGFDTLQARMNETIDFISNSKNPKAIRLINCYPYKVSPRNLSQVTQITRELADLCHQIQQQTR